MVMSVKVPFGAYAPGQKVRFNVVLDNQSDVHCSDVKVRLMKKIIYISRSPETKTKETELKVSDNHCGEVVKLNKAEFNEFLQIPSTTPSSLESCSIIKVSYTLKFIAKVSRIHGDLVIEFPFTIGTVPLYASTADEGAITTQPGSGPIYKPIRKLIFMIFYFLYINIYFYQYIIEAPPMFEEDVRAEQFESNTFKPRYPVFLNDPSLSANGTSGPSGPPPSAAPASNNLYPTANISAVTPTPPRAAMIPSAPPPSAPELQPLNPAHVMPSPSQPISQHNTPKAGTNNQPPLEVMGFSLPPDYEPTSADSTGNIGWK